MNKPESTSDYCQYCDGPCTVPDPKPYCRICQEPTESKRFHEGWYTNGDALIRYLYICANGHKERYAHYR